MKKTLRLIAVAALAVVLASCMTAKTEKKNVAYAGMYEEKPVSVLLMPPINRSTAVEAKEYFYSTLMTPVAEHGYYVIPPFISMEILKRESAYDAERFLEAPLKKFGQLYGADVALFTVIHKWDKSALFNTITIDVEYIFRSVDTGATLYKRRGAIVYDTSVASGGGSIWALVAKVAVNAIATAATDYVPVSRQCNNYTLSDMPAGKYHKDFGLDGDKPAGAPQFQASLKN